MAKAGIPMTCNRVGGMFGLFFSEHQVNRFEQATQCNIGQFKQFFHGMLDHGVYMAPSAYEAGFVSSTHMNEELDRTIEAAKIVLKSME